MSPSLILVSSRCIRLEVILELGSLFSYLI